jgi:hypothetical protein
LWRILLTSLIGELFWSAGFSQSYASLWTNVSPDFERLKQDHFGLKGNGSMIMPAFSLPRGHPRHLVHRIASYYFGGKRFLTVTLDLGMGGMKIKTPHCLPEGDHLSFRLVLESDAIWLKGRIVYSRFLPDKQGVSGVQFIDLSADAHSLLQGYLSTVEAWPKARGMISAGEGDSGEMPRRKTAKD